MMHGASASSNSSWASKVTVTDSHAAGQSMINTLTLTTSWCCGKVSMGAWTTVCACAVIPVLIVFL